MARVRVRIHGRVQGVGFRASTQNEAQAHGLAGWVRNTPEGCVEAEFEGPKSQVESMLAWCRSGPSVARVTDIEERWLSDDDASGGGTFKVRG